MKLLLLLFAIFTFLIPQAHALQSLQQIRFADNVTIAAPGSAVTQWFDIRHFTSIDFVIVATAGDGNIEVEYSSDSAGLSQIADGTVLAFDTTEAYSLTGGVVGKFYTRLRVDCVTAPCTYSGWFTAKGQR